MGLHENLLRGIYANGRNITNRTEKNKSKVITTCGSYGAGEGRRKQTKGRSKNKKWMNVWWEFGEREENVNKIKIVWLWWEVDVTIGKYGGGNIG